MVTELTALEQDRRIAEVVARESSRLKRFMLWNWVMPVTFGLPVISFWQALGLLALSRILLGGFHGGMGPRVHWRRRMRERLEQMTPEQREQFLAGMQRRCGRFEPGAAERVS